MSDSPIPTPSSAPQPAQPQAPVMPGEPQIQEEETHLKHGSFWSNPEVAAITGAATSVLIHAVIIVVCLMFFYKPLRDAVTDLVTPQEQTIIPTAELATDTPGGIPNPGMNNDPTHASEQNTDPSVKDSDSFADNKSEQLTNALTSGASDSSSNAIAIGGNKSGIGSGKGFGDGGGKLAKFGTPGGGQGIGPKGAVFGNGGNATKIVFLVDGTGTMVGLRFDLLRKELKATVSKLIPKQEFNIVLFSNADNYDSPDKNGLMYATDPLRRKAFDFLDKFSPSGQTNPLPAIEAAFKMKPQLMYILSDGEFDNLVSYDEVTSTIEKLNSDKKVKINTILFGDRDKKAEDALRKISTTSGGSFTFVTPDMLMKN